MPLFYVTVLPFFTSFKTSSQSLGTVGSFHSPTSSVGTLSKSSGLPMLRIVFLGGDSCPKSSGLPFFTSFKTSSSVGTLPKAFQTNTTCSFGFFNAPQLTKASFRRCVALKKPLICMRGFVERTGIEPVLPG